MDSWKKTQKIDNPFSARNLRKGELGGVIFGCKNNTMDECLSKQLFGLPYIHISYVKNVEPGLPLFLFNYTDRKLHGVYEAASRGQLNIDEYAWIDDGYEKTSFPAQVRIHIKKECQPLLEKQFKKIIKDNYYSSQQGQLFWFELDSAQTRALLKLFQPLPVKPTWVPAASSFPGASSLPVKPAPSHVSSDLPPKPRQGLVPSSWADLLKPAPSPMLKATGDLEYATAEASSWADLLKSESNPKLKATGDSEYVNVEVQELINDPKSCLDLVDNNKFASLQFHDGDNECDNSSTTVSSDYGDLAPDEPVSDWEDLVEDEMVTHSGANPYLDADNQTLQTRRSGIEGLETDAEQVSPMLKDICANHQFLNSPSNCGINGGAIPCVQGEMYQNNEHFTEDPIIFHERDSAASDICHGNVELVQVIEDLKERTLKLELQKAESDREMQHLRDLVMGSERTIQLLKNRVKELESKNDPSMALEDSLNQFVEQYLGSENVMYLIGGFDGSSWLSSLDSFSPSLDILTPLKTMRSSRAYASAVTCNGSVYVFGGGDGRSWYDTVERYDPRHDEWTICPPMIRKKGSLAGATLNGKIFSIGGGDGSDCFSNVEMFDPVSGIWINSQSMHQKRFALAAAELNGAVYAAGGYDGNYYLMSAERLDPRVPGPYWTMLPNMNFKRGCHSLAVLDEKLYALGGFNGEEMVSSVEIYDPRLNRWMMGEPMNAVRGYGAAAVLGDSLYAIGGVLDGQKNIVDTVECYRVGFGWVSSDLKAIGRRCFCSAVTL